jgi:hypothetical protein
MVLVRLLFDSYNLALSYEGSIIIIALVLRKLFQV